MGDRDSVEINLQKFSSVYYTDLVVENSSSHSDFSPGSPNCLKTGFKK